MMLNASIIDHEINVNSLVLSESCFNPKTEPIRSNYFVADLKSHHHIITKPHRLDLIKVRQYGVEIFNDEISSDSTIYDFLPIDLRISFENDRWKILFRKEGEEYEDVDYGYLPYSYADTLNIIIKSLNFDFHIDNTLIQKAQPFNLTIRNLNPIESMNKYLVKADDEPKLKITSSGSWDLFDKKPEIIVVLPISLDYSAPQSMNIKREIYMNSKRKFHLKNQQVHSYSLLIHIFASVQPNRNALNSKQNLKKKKKTVNNFVNQALIIHRLMVDMKNVFHFINLLAILIFLMERILTKIFHQFQTQLIIY